MSVVVAMVMTTIVRLVVKDVSPPLLLTLLIFAVTRTRGGKTARIGRPFLARPGIRASRLRPPVEDVRLVAGGGREVLLLSEVTGHGSEEVVCIRSSDQT